MEADLEAEIHTVAKDALKKLTEHPDQDLAARARKSLDRIDGVPPR